MDTKQENKKTVKENKNEKAIATILKNRGFDSHVVINKTDDVLLVAYGYKNHKLSELIKHDFKAKTNDTTIVNGELGFNEFVERVKALHSLHA
ncbi:hypothetical protein FORMB_16960 [Formosa sp. Hel1_33_131]|uniref:hypothetical protein n=1 Tax=Formosa sp. Hel1_33_131 TaxID=1336794 RepID=UPI00084E1658|nr:hypothetical protein [Formosa sp. Hel1_33_131]AOR28735.1 hypothetical protein FORMB_16960 [Formosa sp. Hel1_33_131]